MCDASIQSLSPFNQYRKYAKNSLFLYWDRSSINNVYSAFFSLPAYFIFLAFFYSCFVTEHLTVTSLLIWQMNTASSTNRFKNPGFSSLLRHFIDTSQSEMGQICQTATTRFDCWWTERTAPSSPARSVCLASLPAGPERVRLSVKHFRFSPFFKNLSYCTLHTVEVQLSATCWCTNMNKWFK